MNPLTYYTLDVFTETPFGGNPLAVFPYATELTTEIMQKIAKEFNLSETVFVFPPTSPDYSHSLRIFSPNSELPFAGHPTVGTAFLLATLDQQKFPSSTLQYNFEEGIGKIEIQVSLDEQNNAIYSDFKTTKSPDIYHSYDININQLAQLLEISIEDIIVDNHFPQALSCGIPYLCVQLKSRSTMDNLRLNLSLWKQYLSESVAPNLYLFTTDCVDKTCDFHARMFAPALGIHEDPATGSAITALGGYLAQFQSQESGEFSWKIEQGIAMNRPSLLQVTVTKENKEITSIRVGGKSVIISQGQILAPL